MSLSFDDRHIPQGVFRWLHAVRVECTYPVEHGIERVPSVEFREKHEIVQVEHVRVDRVDAVFNNGT